MTRLANARALFLGKKKKSFTIVELIVSVALFMVAVAIAFSATIGANGLIQQAETRSMLIEATRNTSEVLRRSSTLARTGDITIEDPISISNTNGKDTLVIRQFLSDIREQTCIKVGRADQDFTFDSNGTVLAAKIYDDTCSGPPLYQGRLTDSRVEVTKFEKSIVVAYGGSNYGLLRYSLSVREAQSRVDQNKRPSIDLVTSMPVGLGQ